MLLLQLHAQFITPINFKNKWRSSYKLIVSIFTREMAILCCKESFQPSSAIGKSSGLLWNLLQIKNKFLRVFNYYLEKNTNFSSDITTHMRETTAPNLHLKKFKTWSSIILQVGKSYGPNHSIWQLLSKVASGSTPGMTWHIQLLTLLFHL